MSIKQLRLQKGLSQEKLAELTGLSIRTIQRVEKENKASLESLNMLSNALEIPITTIQESMQNTKQHSSEKKSSDNTNSWVKFIVVNLILFAVNMLTNPTHLWFFYPLLGWGVFRVYRIYSLKINSLQKNI